MGIRIPPPPPPPPRQPGADKENRAHVRRVTLNLVRHAACCPPVLRPILDRLANELNWDIEALTPREAEAIWSFVDDALTARAVSEFHANTQTIRDWSRTEFPNGEDCCKLCGQQHIRWEFDLVNVAGGRSTRTGSTCIVEYGLSVDGEGTAEEAIAALTSAINRAKRKAECEDWQAAHPDHEVRMSRLSDAFERISRDPAYQSWRYLRANWKGRLKPVLGPVKAAIKYYRREGWLTAHRTDQLFGDTDLWQTVIGMDAELAEAQAKVVESRAFWQGILDEYGPLFNGFEKTVVVNARDRATDKDDTGWGLTPIMARVSAERARRSPVVSPGAQRRLPPPPPPPLRKPPVVVELGPCAPVDDELPF